MLIGRQDGSRQDRYPRAHNLKNNVMAQASRKVNLIIESVQTNGKKFRPSDWIERLSSTLAYFGPDHRLRYTKGIQPRIINGEKCLVVAQSLREENPEAYKFVLEFAQSNQLRIHEEDDEGNRLAS